jgi:predicted acylesterase/phospholipase RssA
VNRSNPLDQFELPEGLPDTGKKRVKVLSLSGGGYRGLFTAQVLSLLEQRLNADQSDKMPVGSHFDLIAGTSIGGILASGLAAGVTAQRLAKLLTEHGEKIFPGLWLRSARKLVWKAPYSPGPLRQAITKAMPDAERIKLSDFKPALLLTSVNWTSSKLHLLGSASTPHKDPLGLSLMDAMLATSAAPAHFPSHAFGNHLFVDGGLVANAPDLHALACANAMYPGAEIFMLSIGTANPQHGRDPSSIPSFGWRWAKPVIELTMNAQEMFAVQEAAATLGSHRYKRLNLSPAPTQLKHLDFDVANAESTQLLMALADQCWNEQSPDAIASLLSRLR